MQEYLSLLRLTTAVRPERLVIRATHDTARLVLRAASLVDERTGAHWALTISSDGRFARVHSGDVKVYENLDVLPRAYVVHDAVWSSSDDQTLQIIAEPDFDPAEEVVLQDAAANIAVDQKQRTAPLGETVEVLSYEPERISIRAHLEEPGYLVLSDTYYAGWTARLDGRLAPIMRANLHFRAVSVPAGGHGVEFVYEPDTLARGARLTVLAFVAWLAALCGVSFCRLRKVAGRVGRGAV